MASCHLHSHNKYKCKNTVKNMTQVHGKVSRAVRVLGNTAHRASRY